MNEFVPVTKLTKGRENKNPIHPVKIFEKVQGNDSQLFVNYTGYISYVAYGRKCVA